MIVRDIMQTDVATVGVDDSLDTAEDIMMIGRMHHLPVVVGNQRLVGLLTERDLAPFASAELSRAIHAGALKAIPVRMVMRCEVLTARPEEPLSHALQVMISNHIGCLPVVDGEKLAGLLTQTDCLQAFAELLTPARQQFVN
jgi:CBS domain-containing protein